MTSEAERLESRVLGPWHPTKLGRSMQSPGLGNKEAPKEIKSSRGTPCSGDPGSYLPTVQLTGLRVVAGKSGQ